jgi:hypothetical protein
MIPIQFSKSQDTVIREEPTGRANARPMTGSAPKQSMWPAKKEWIASPRSQ